MERVFNKILKYGLAVLLIVAMAACGGESTNNPAPGPQPSPEPSDPGGTYTDPGTPPPAPIAEPTIMTSGSLAVSDKAESLVTLNVAGFSVDEPADLRTANLAATLEAGDFTVVEGDVVQGIVVKPVKSGDKVPADIVFVVDTSATMSNALSSVQDGIIDFAGFLESSGLDVRLGAVTFGDAFDTLAENSKRSGISLIDKTPPAFDRDERPTLALTDDLKSFQTFIAEESPRGGGDDPENILGALAFAHRRLEWREGAQRIVVVISDTCSHSEESNYFISEPWAPEQFDDILDEVRARATVHVIGSGNSCLRFKGTVNVAGFTGVKGTGGLFHEWEGRDFDLSKVGLVQTMTNNFLITYKGELNGQEKDVRLVIDNGEALKGEFTLKATY